MKWEELVDKRFQFPLVPFFSLSPTAYTLPPWISQFLSPAPTSAAVSLLSSEWVTCWFENKTKRKKIREGSFLGGGEKKKKNFEKKKKKKNLSYSEEQRIIGWRRRNFRVFSREPHVVTEAGQRLCQRGVFISFEGSGESGTVFFFFSSFILNI